MGLFGGKKANGFLGVDIGTSGIKLVELEEEKGRPKLSTYAYANRPKGSVSFLDTPKETGAFIAKMIKESGAEATNVMAALPSAQVFSTILSIPRGKDEKTMKPMIHAQVSKLTPMPLADMFLYSTFIDPVGAKDKKSDKSAKTKAGNSESKAEETAPASVLKAAESDYVRVLVAGAAKTLVQKYIAVFKEAKLTLRALDTESFALVRSLIGKDKSSVLVVDIGFDRSNFIIVEKGIPFLTRSISIGGKDVTKRIAEQMKILPEKAEQLKQTLTLSGTVGSLGPVIDPLVQAIVNEVKYAFQVYANVEHAQGKRVEKIILTGGTALLNGLPEILEETLNINVYRGDPWARVVYPADLRPVLDEIGARMSVAVGLAMRDMIS